MDILNREGTGFFWQNPNIDVFGHSFQTPIQCPLDSNQDPLNLIGRLNSETSRNSIEI